jgi:hypothetical protein
MCNAWFGGASRGPAVTDCFRFVHLRPRVGGGYLSCVWATQPWASAR